ncbi:hypothetical protein BN1708_015805 [Verticillium longisporum]|uniref:Uncharacterized protein n=1 Tax=Verticillium longisporum TaxID=100787 RepID=A0A0G4M9H5_VERLO|nr:hypothetical protein BN1708_015805 [Verticillium longisporum]
MVASMTEMKVKSADATANLDSRSNVRGSDDSQEMMAMMTEKTTVLQRGPPEVTIVFRMSSLEDTPPSMDDVSERTESATAAMRGPMAVLRPPNHWKPLGSGAASTSPAARGLPSPTGLTRFSREEESRSEPPVSCVAMIVNKTMRLGWGKYLAPVGVSTDGTLAH